MTPSGESNENSVRSDTRFVERPADCQRVGVRPCVKVKAIAKQSVYVGLPEHAKWNIARYDYTSLQSD